MSGPDNADLAAGDPDDGHINEIGRKSRRGLTWSLAGGFIARLGSFGVTLVMARLLTPADFGVYAVALAAMGIAMQVNDAGIIPACVQWRGKFEDIAPTGATLALLSSIFVYGVLWVSAPAFATLSGTPEAAPVVRLITLFVVVDGVMAMRGAALVRRFEQDQLTKANMVGTVVNAAIALPLGFAGAGAYSLAIAYLTGQTVTSVLVFRMGNLPVKFALDKDIAKKLFAFGLPLAASFAIESMLVNADYVIVGNVLGTVWLGYYLVAFNISNWVPGMVGTAMRYVSVSGFSRLAEQGIESVIVGVRSTIPTLVSAILPIAVIIATLAPQVIHVLFGDKWALSAVVLPYLMVLMVIRMLNSLAIDILTALGSTKITVWLNAGWAVALIPALWVGTHLDGIRGTAIAHAVVAVCVALPLGMWALHLAGIRLGPTLHALIRPVFGAAISTATSMFVLSLVSGRPLTQLVVAGGAATVVYILVVVPRDQLRLLKSSVLRASRKPGAI